jgi:hypothetical protein
MGCFLSKQYKQTIDDLYKYAYDIINRDRTEYSVAPVFFSRNVAAQLHAEDIMGAKQLSHWTTDGMKPYMKYSMHNGTGYVKQNAACKQIIIPYGIGLYNSSRIDPARSIEELEYAMMYDDSSENILDKRGVSISIYILDKRGVSISISPGTSYVTTELYSIRLLWDSVGLFFQVGGVILCCIV